LFVASGHGREDVVERLLEVADIEVNKATKTGSTPLIAASRDGYDEIVKRLLAVPEIDVNKSDRNGETALYGAARAGYVENIPVIERLLAFGIDIEKKSNTGQTALDIARERGAHPEIIRLLEEAHRALNQARNSARNVGRLRGTIANEGSVVSSLPHAIQSHVGSYLSGYGGTLEEQMKKLRKAGASNELFAPGGAGPAMGGAGGGGAGAGAGAGAQGGGRRRTRRMRRKRRQTRRKN